MKIDTMRRLAAKFGKRLDEVEIRRHETEKLDMSFTDRLESVQTDRSAGFALRVFARGVSAFACTDDADSVEATLASLARAVEAAPAGTVRLAPAAPIRCTHRFRPREDPRLVPVAAKKRLLKGFVRRLKARSPHVVASSASYHESFDRIRLVTSSGTVASADRLDLYAAVAATAHRDGVTQLDHESTGSSVDFGVVRGLSALLDGTVDMAVALTRAPKAEAGKTTVILDPQLACVFVHEAFGHTAEADGICDSPEKMKIMRPGTRFGSDLLTIFDGGLEAGSRGHLPFDDEGTPGERTPVIDRGILVGLLHSRATAAAMKARPTGSARAIDWRNPPIVRMRCTCIGPGPHSFAQMLEGVKRGLYCRKSVGGTGGEAFTFSVGHAYEIRDGRIGRLVRDAKLSGNLFTTLRKIDRVGDDFRVVENAGGCGKRGQFPLPVAYGAPHIRIRDVVVGGA